MLRSTDAAVTVSGRGVTSKAEAVQRAVDAVRAVAGGAWPTEVCVQFKPAVGQEVRREVGQALATLTGSEHNIEDVWPCTRCAGVGGRQSSMCPVHRKANADASKSSRAKTARADVHAAGAVLDAMRKTPLPTCAVAASSPAATRAVKRARVEQVATAHASPLLAAASASAVPTRPAQQRLQQFLCDFAKRGGCTMVSAKPGGANIENRLSPSTDTLRALTWGAVGGVDEPGFREVGGWKRVGMLRLSKATLHTVLGRDTFRQGGTAPRRNYHRKSDDPTRVRLELSMSVQKRRETAKALFNLVHEMRGEPPPKWTPSKLKDPDDATTADFCAAWDLLHETGWAWCGRCATTLASA